MDKDLFDQLPKELQERARICAGCFGNGEIIVVEQDGSERRIPCKECNSNKKDVKDDATP